MYTLLKRPEQPQVRQGRAIEIGYTVRADQAGLIWDEPRQYKRDVQDAKSAKSLQNCPAILDYEARTFLVTCPVDLSLRLVKNKEGKLALQNLDGPQSAVAPNHLAKLVHLNGESQWRQPNRPLVQISTPYRFLCDEPCWMNQLPPYMHYREPQLPGLFVGGRLPIHIWPRVMMWAFEWHDVSKPLLLRRGEPWFYMRFETEDPTRPIRMVEAEWTPELEEYNKGIEAVTNYVKRTFSLFPLAQKRRPAKLLKRKERQRTSAHRPVTADIMTSS